MSNPTVVNVIGVGVYTPEEAIELVSRTGAKKGNMRPDKVFLSAVSAGCLLSFACAVSISVTAAPWYQQNAPGLIRMVGALVFPLGLVMILYVILLTGGWGSLIVSLTRTAEQPHRSRPVHRDQHVHRRGSASWPVIARQDVASLVSLLLGKPCWRALCHGPDIWV